MKRLRAKRCIAYIDHILAEEDVRRAEVAVREAEKLHEVARLKYEQLEAQQPQPWSIDRKDEAK